MNRQIIEEAADWFVEVSDGQVDAATRHRFHAWLTRSPEHVRAFLKILPMWHDGAQLDAGGDSDALIAQARAASNVVPLTAGAHQPQRIDAGAQSPAKTRRFSYKYAFAATLLVVATAAFVFLATNNAVYATSVGEQRTVVLEDGSNVELNSRSRIKIRFSDRQRSIELLEGQALFRVAKDAARPFVVQSGDTSVRAVGTQFDVYRKRSGTVVTVVEGKVAVSSVVLTAGQQLTVASTMPAQPKPANVGVATAWTRKQLVFFSTPLPEVAEEFNRYNERQLILKSEGLQAFNVSGAFSSTDPASLIRFLRAQPGLQVEEGRNAVTVASK